jgi:hypothetical protein
MKKTILPGLALVIAIFLFSVAANAQALDTVLKKHGEQYQPERAYLHYDKSTYYPGETIWFKAYLMEDIYPAFGSKTFYLDWVGENGQLLSHTVWPLIEGASAGQFTIPSTYTGGAIHVRGYTKWMLNFDTSFLYTKNIRVLSKTPVNATAAKAAIPTLQFFPEGGELVAGVPNKIAFKANDQWGRPVNVKGEVRDNKGAVVQSFASVHDGLGALSMLPQAGNTYTARWKDAKGTEHTTTLPAVKASGISMQVTQSPGRRSVLLYATPGSPESPAKLNLVGTMNGRMAFRTTADLSPRGNTLKIIPTQSFPTGILTITVFDAGWKPLAERITFINNNDYSFPTQMTVEHWGLSKRARNEIRITVPDSLEANLSISVTDAEIEHDSSHTIMSELLLSGYLKGEVYNPSYYFSGNSDTVQQHLDLVMLTHGWRRFNWDNLVKGVLPTITYPKDTSYLTVSGQIYGATRGQVGAGDNIVLILKENDTSSKMVFLPIDQKGVFADPELMFFDTLQVYYQVKSKILRGADVRFMTSRLPAPTYGPTGTRLSVFPPLSDTTGQYRHSLLAGESLRLAQSNNARMMENITVTAKAKTPLQQIDEKYTRGLFSGPDAVQFDLINNPALGHINILDYLSGRVAGLQITGGGESIQWRGGQPQIYLDEIATDVDMIRSVPVSDIAYIKVFRPPFVGSGGGGGSGAIAIYTRKGGDVASTPGKGLDRNTIAGYTAIRQFYSPNYSTIDRRNEARDVRTTLYWNPMVLTSAKNRSVVLRFYNNDTAKAFRVVIEGMTREGLLTRYVEMME